VADVKQCTLTGEADHILAVRFLSKFINNTPWIHMDLSASRNEGGLGAALSDVTGFGVLWGAQFIDSWAKKEL
jgi:leucyl aminopeptidase